MKKYYNYLTIIIFLIYNSIDPLFARDGNDIVRASIKFPEPISPVQRKVIDFLFLIAGTYGVMLMWLIWIISISFLVLSYYGAKHKTKKRWIFALVLFVIFLLIYLIRFLTESYFEAPRL